MARNKNQSFSLSQNKLDNQAKEEKKIPTEIRLVRDFGY